MGDLVLVFSARLGRTNPPLDLPHPRSWTEPGPLGTGVHSGRLARRCSGCVPVRILPVGLPFPLAFHLELKGLRESSAGQSGVGGEGIRGSEMALAGQEDGLVCGWMWVE